MGRALRGSCFPLLALCLILLAGCGTTTSTHRLPAYETPIAKTEYQTVRTTAYTHTESDHLAYTNHNALGGILHAASTPLSTGPMVATNEPVRPDASDYADEIGGLRRVSNPEPTPAPVVRTAAMARPTRQPSRPTATLPPVRNQSNASESAATSDDGNPPWMAEYLRRKKLQQQGGSTRGAVYYATPFYRPVTAPVVYGSAAADWSRWPVGTVFQIQSTGQIYKVDDYGWALAGRNTIDLYHPTRATMNAWGVRQVPIHVLHWGSREESLRLLVRHQNYKHIRRMVLELRGHDQEAAELR